MAQKNLKTVAEGGWNVSKAVANNVLTQAALAWYDVTLSCPSSALPVAKLHGLAGVNAAHH